MTYDPESLIANQYEVVSRPMKGGMGIVYFCLDHGNEKRPVALKTFKPEYLPDRNARDRFLREGTTWMQLGKHTNIVRCYEVEYTDPTAFLVLELIAKEQDREDASLRSWIVEAMQLDQSLLFALQIARGMKYATEKMPGFVHRDLKPENILVGADKLPGTNINRLRVTDFGLVTMLNGEGEKLKDEDSQNLIGHTHLTKGIVGTPYYMSPEQWKGEQLGSFTDIYALGCILYEMITGQRAVQGKDLNELKDAHCRGNLCPLPKTLPNVVKSFIIRCTAVLPADRYKDWEDVIAVLEHAYYEVSEKHAPTETNANQPNSDERLQYVRSLMAIGLAYQDMGKTGAAASYYQKAITIARETNNREEEAIALGSIGSIHLHLGDAKQAINYFLQSLNIAHEMGETLLESSVLGNLGIANKDLGNYRQAIAYYEKQLVLVREIHHQHGEGAALANLGIAYEELGDKDRSIGYQEQALTIFRKIGNRRGVSAALSNMGSVYLNFHDLRQAVSCLEQSLVITREIGDRRGEQKNLNNLGKAYRWLGNTWQAIKNFEQSLLIAHELSDKREESIVLGSLGDAYSGGLGEPQRAIEYYKRALVLHCETGDRKGESAALGSLGSAYTALGQVQLAIEYLEKSLSLNQEIGDRNREAGSFNSLGIAYSSLGDKRKAIEYFEQSLEISREFTDQYGEGNALSNLGCMYLALADERQAMNYFEQAINIRRKIGDLKGVATDSLNMAGVYAQQSQFARALPLAQDAANIFTRIGHTEYAQRAQQLINQIQGNNTTSTQSDQEASAAIEAFLSARSIQDMQLTVQKYPAFKNTQLLQAIEFFLRTQIPTEQQPAFIQRLNWLKQVLGKKDNR